ncbi:MAG: LysM peptidoglycan-binding domain-containing protein [Verrucomicrobiia bacterium]
MTLFSVPLRLLTLALLVLALSGCVPVDSGGGDEQKDMHFLAGKSRLNSMDYDGAIAAFENALISNPKSASAHFELGLLYEHKKSNYAAAIYHFERFLHLRPQSKWTETVNQHITACKVQLARTVSFRLAGEEVQEEIRKLTTTNSELRKQVELLKAQLRDQAAEFSNKLAVVSQVSLPVPDLQTQRREPERREPQRREPERREPERRSSTPEPRSPGPDRTLIYGQRPAASAAQRPNPQPGFRSQPYPMAMPRTHIVKQGETLSGISQKYNIKLSALQRANPYVDARRLRAGQVLNIPSTGN